MYARLETVDDRRVEGKYLRQCDIQSIDALDGDIGAGGLKSLAEGQGLRRGRSALEATPEPQLTAPSGMPPLPSAVATIWPGTSHAVLVL